MKKEFTAQDVNEIAKENWVAGKVGNFTECHWIGKEGVDDVIWITSCGKEVNEMNSTAFEVCPYCNRPVWLCQEKALAKALYDYKEKKLIEITDTCLNCRPKVFNDGLCVGIEKVLKKLRVMATAWDNAHLSTGSQWNKALTQCGKSVEALIKHFEQEARR